MSEQAPMDIDPVVVAALDAMRTVTPPEGVSVSPSVSASPGKPKERKESRPALVTCATCGKGFSASDEPDFGDCGHMLHESCDNACGDCRTKNAQNFAGDKDFLILMGHGTSGQGETFVPLGTEISAYVTPGEALDSFEVYKLIVDPKGGVPIKARYGALNSIPNFVLTPNKPIELQGDLAAAKKFGTGASFFFLGDEEFVIPDLRGPLCASPKTCKPPFHTCNGLLRSFKGVVDLRIATCLGGAEVKATQVDEEWIKDVCTRGDAIIDKGAKDLAAAMKDYEALDDRQQDYLLYRVPKDAFYDWHEMAKDALSKGKKILRVT
ncbi:putative adhesin [Streptomyces sp. NPDC047028]|uniref:putative adhesin n=1 Tax=Streptomyces sp. NPDC047028 TaxID=3155793 RepID=UPI0033DAE6D7